MSKNRAKNPVDTGIPPDPEKFIRLIHRRYPIIQAKKLAGYSPNYATSRILATKRAKYALRTIEEQRDTAISTPGRTLTDGVDFLQEIRDDPGEDTPDRIRANKEINATLGYNAPTKIESESKSLALELSLTGEDLLAMAGTITP